MLVSVVVACYNVEKYVQKCVDSIKKQTYKNLEIILYDDCSKDNTREILNEIKKQDNRIKVFLGKENYGPGGAKQEGLKRCSGEYVCFVDSDDYIGENYIMDMIKTVKEDKDIDIVSTNFTKVDQNGNVSYIRDYKNNETVLWQKISTVSKLFKKSFLDKNKLSLPYGIVLEDVLFSSACLLAKPKIVFCNTTEYYYVFNNSSISHTTLKKFKKNSLDQSQEYLLSLKKLFNEKDEEELLSYFSFKFTCWYLLKSGSNVGKVEMKKEYSKAFSFLEKEFPKFKKNKYISLFHPQKERKIIFFVLYNTKILYKLHLSRFFYQLYGMINLEKLWPNL